MSDIRYRMRRIVHSAGFLFLLVTAFCVAAIAQPAQVTLDPAQTKINISVHDVHGGFQGSFKLKSGILTFDRQTGAANGELIVDAATGDTGNSSRNRKMYKDLLEIQRYPEITFAAKKVMGDLAPQENSNVQVQGMFHIHGVEHDLTLSVAVQFNADKVTAMTSFVVPYESWRMKNPSLFFLRVDGKADVSVSVVGRVTLGNDGSASR
jgi:polyisoprenoid-binding protein YceI